MAAQIFIVEDHPAVLSAYELLLRRELDLQVVGTATSAEDALVLIPQQQPDLVIVDISLPGIDGLTLSQHLQQKQPALPILIVTSHERTLQSIRHSPVLVPNIKGYLHKAAAVQTLVPTIRQVLAL
jgi:DNA-binding NarL/FixJ family response regulator